MICDVKILKQQGQTLIEAVVALGAAVLVLSAIAVAVISALNNVQFTKNQNQATQYAQEAIEVMRQISQSNWGYFSLQNNKYCLDDGSSVLKPIPVNGCGQNIGIFVREVHIAQGSQASCLSGSIGITVIVSWSDSKCTNPDEPYCHMVKLNSCLSNHNSNVVAP